MAFVRSLFVPDDLARRDFPAIERRAAEIIAKLAEAGSVHRPDASAEAL